jgi:hypothetical protein
MRRKTLLSTGSGSERRRCTCPSCFPVQSLNEDEEMEREVNDASLKQQRPRQEFAEYIKAIVGNNWFAGQLKNEGRMELSGTKHLGKSST